MKTGTQDWKYAVIDLEERLGLALAQLESGRDMAAYQALEAAARPLTIPRGISLLNPQLEQRAQRLRATAVLAAKLAGDGRLAFAASLVRSALEEPASK